jgi:hypothetical protein
MEAGTLPVLMGAAHGPRSVREGYASSGEKVPAKLVAEASARQPWRHGHRVLRVVTARSRWAAGVLKMLG